ncbi:MAG: hypothetical protein APR62_01860 [Smithella sp. SDB]|nr:MAG: hypothetical protein APR62_01860 [Smithella sp. SDB]
MIKIKSNHIAYVIMFCLIFFLPLFGCAHSIAGQKPVGIAVAEIAKQSIKKEELFAVGKSENHPVKKSEVDTQDEDNSPDFNLNDSLVQQNGTSEEKQDIMEKALDLLETADKLSKNGDFEKTLDTLDEAYSLVIDANGDSAIAQAKDDLRLLISRRILAVYSSRHMAIKGKNSEVPLVMNADIEKEICSFQGPERESFIAAYQRSGLYRPVIVKALRKAGIPEEFFWLPLVESFFKVNAYSSARALGLWQFIPSTGYKFGLSRDEWIDERMDVQKSTQAAIAYLKELHNMFGDWLTVLAAYNCGEGRVLRVISSQHINYFDSFWDLYRQLPNETARYVPRFLATLHIVKNPQKYGFDLSDPAKPIFGETVKVNKIMKLKDIAEKIEVPEETLELLNSELKYKLTPDHEYDLTLPKGSLDKFNLVVNDISQSEKPRYVSTRKVFIKHRVKRGESLYSIARKYKVSIASIRSYNRLRSNRLIQGRRLTIPVIRGKNANRNNKKQHQSKTFSSKYKVRGGDTLSIIASRFESSTSQIKEINNMKTDKIYIGQILRIP